MKENVLITCIDDFSETLAKVFAREGFQIFAMGPEKKPQPHPSIENVTLLPTAPDKAATAFKEKADKLDYMIDTTNYRSPKDTFTIRDGIDCAVIEQVYRKNVLRSMALLEAFLPFLDKGEGKRLFYLTSAEASINETRHINQFAYNMSKAALHQFIQMTRNKLAPKGYTFRVFDPMLGEVSTEAAAESAYSYITRRRGTENHDPLRDDEDNLVFRDALGRQHCW